MLFVCMSVLTVLLLFALMLVLFALVLRCCMPEFLASAFAPVFRCCPSTCLYSVVVCAGVGCCPSECLYRVVVCAGVWVLSFCISVFTVLLFTLVFGCCPSA